MPYMLCVADEITMIIALQWPISKYQSFKVRFEIVS